MLAFVNAHFCPMFHGSKARNGLSMAKRARVDCEDDNSIPVRRKIICISVPSHRFFLKIFMPRLLWIAITAAQVSFSSSSSIKVPASTR